MKESIVKLKCVLSVIISAVLCINSTILAGTYSGGSGTIAEPYRIGDKDDWQELMATPLDWGANFILTEDLNLAGIALTPVGNLTTKFTGIFDGNNLTIHNVVINQPSVSYIGLFGYVGSSGQIKNLGVADANIQGNSYVGAIVGYNNGGTITSCYATGTVSNTGNYLGGIVGLNDVGTITSCYATASIGGHSYVGGLVGQNHYGTIISCYSTGNVAGTNNDSYCVGGLVGWNWSASITASYSTCIVSIAQIQVGGLVAVNTGTINSCYAKGSVSGLGYVGGLVSQNYNGGTIAQCYATGAVSATYYFGGLVGSNDTSTTSCFWDTQTSGCSIGVGNGSMEEVTGKVTTEMKTKSTFTDAGWDFVNIWKINEGNDYPQHRNNSSEISAPPTADAKGPYAVYIGNALTLDASGSTDDENNIISYMWDLDNDGTFETDAGNQAVLDVSYQYLQSLGLLINVTYNIRLKITDIDQQNDIALSTLTFLPVVLYRGDLDADGVLDYSDLLILASQWLQPPGYPNNADIAPNGGDGIVNFLDFSVLAKDWLQDSALAAALSGLEFMKYWLKDIHMAYTVAPEDRFGVLADLLDALLPPELNLEKTLNTVTLSNVSINPSLGQSFTALIRPDPANIDMLQMYITGISGEASETIMVNYVYGTRAHNVFDFGVATKGSLHLIGSVSINGANIVVNSSVYIETEEDVALEIIGKSSITGEVNITNPDAVVNLSNNASVGGEKMPAALNHIFKGVEPTEFSVPMPDYFEKYVQTTYNPTNPLTTYNNVRIPAGTNPSFSAGTTINGVLYIESPNVVIFTGHVNINGIVVGEGDLNDNSGTNLIAFLGTIEHNPVSSLDANNPAFSDLRNEKGTFLMAPGFSAAFGGDFETINGAIAANGVNFAGNAGGTIQGSIINYSTAPMELSCNSDLFVNRSGLDEVPAGFGPEIILYFLPDSYSEVSQINQ